MHRVFILIAFIAFGLGWHPAFAAPEKIKTHKISDEVSANEYKLDNGLTVVLIENPKAPAASIYHWVKAGSLHERPGITGIAHLFEHMMFRPLKPSEASFGDKMKRLAAQINASTRFESTVYNTTVPSPNLHEAIKHEADRFKNMQVTDDLLDVEREAVRSEYSTKFDVSPVVDLWFRTYQEAFPNHPYGWMIIGFRKDLDQIKAKDANEFFKTYYVPSNTGLFISGSFDSDEVIKWVEKEYGSWKKGKDSALPPEFKHTGGFVEKTGKLGSSSPMAIVGHRLPHVSRENFLLLNLMNHILYDSQMSLAKQKLLFGTPLVSEVSSFNFGYDNGMIKAIVAPLPGANLDNIVSAINSLPQELEKLTDEEYAAYLREYRISLLEQLQRNQSLASIMSLTWGKYGNLEFVPNLVQSEIEYPKEKLVQFAKQMIQPKNTVVLKTKTEKK